MPAGPNRVQQEAVAHPAQHEDLASSEVWEGGDWISPTRESGSSPSTVGRNEVGSRHTPREGPPPSWGGGEGLVSTREPFSFSPSASGGSEEGSGSSLDYSVGNRQFSVQLPGVCRGEGLDGRARYGMSSLSRGGRGPRGRGGVHPGTLFCSPRLPSPPPTTAAAASATATRSTSVLCPLSFPFIEFGCFYHAHADRGGVARTQVVVARPVHRYPGPLPLHHALHHHLHLAHCFLCRPRHSRARRSVGEQRSQAIQARPMWTLLQFVDLATNPSRQLLQFEE